MPKITNRELPGIVMGLRALAPVVPFRLGLRVRAMLATLTPKVEAFAAEEMKIIAAYATGPEKDKDGQPVPGRWAIPNEKQAEVSELLKELHGIEIAHSFTPINASECGKIDGEGHLTVNGQRVQVDMLAVLGMGEWFVDDVTA